VIYSSIVGFAGSNPTEGMGVSLCMFTVCCVGSGLSDVLITRSEEPYRLYVCVCQIVRDIETSSKSRPMPELRYGTTKKIACLLTCIELQT
jgi:3-polyprenyl-4-hydroxybenzoate decarboxylase